MVVTLLLTPLKFQEFSFFFNKILPAVRLVLLVGDY